jgi:hypothetical protein
MKSVPSARRLHHLTNIVGRHRAAPLAGEGIASILRLFSLQFAQCP